MATVINKYSLLFIILLSSLVSSGQPDAINDSVVAANQLYNKARYQEAIRKYQYVIGQGYESSDLYYNLGNAFYKTGNATFAIINYERAKKLAPNDDDIRYNLQLARTQIVDNIVTLPEPGFMRWWKELISSKPVGFWGTLSISTFFAFLFLFGLFLFSRSFQTKRLTFWFSMGALFIALLTFSFGSSLRSTLLKHNTAVITERSVKVKASPSETGTEIFIVHEGVTVQVTEKLGEWVAVSFPDGNKGWVKESSIIRI